MPDYIISILIQLPIVALFIWYNERKDTQFQKFLGDQRSADRAILDKLNDAFEAHDIRMQNAITKMEERTRPRRRSNANQDQ
jgi:hypothetical protein